MPKEKKKGYCSPAEVSAYLGLSRAQVYKLVNEGVLRALRLPGTGASGRATVRVALESVEELERASAVRPR